MPKDILLYGYIHSDSAKEFFTSIEKASENSDNPELTLRINTGGGEPHYMMGMLAKIQELGINIGKVDGMAYSAGLYACCLLEEVECVEGGQFLLHRASMWYESYPELFTDADKKRLEDINKFLRKILVAKVDVAKLEKIAKRSIDEIFSMDNRIDVVLTATEARSIGLVDEIVKLTPKRKKIIESNVEMVNDEKFKIAAKKILSITASDDDDDSTKITQTKNSTEMTIEKLKAEHPALYASIVKEGQQAERNRISAWLAFQKIDAEAVAKGIKDGEEVNATVIAEFSVKALNAKGLEAIKSESPKDVTTSGEPDKAKTEKEKEVASFEASIDKMLGLGEKK